MTRISVRRSSSKAIQVSCMYSIQCCCYCYCCIFCYCCCFKLDLYNSQTWFNPL